VLKSKPTPKASSTAAAPLALLRNGARRSSTVLSEVKRVVIDEAAVDAFKDKRIGERIKVTAKSRFARAVAAVSDWCRKHRHWSIRDQHRHLSSMMRGHFAY
jgi:hypothetical protein